MNETTRKADTRPSSSNAHTTKDGLWTPEIISRFWDYVGRQPRQRDLCFSHQVGDAIIRLLQESGSVQRGIAALDFGCASGFLLQPLLDQGVVCYGVDSSPAQVRFVNEKYNGRPGWKGAQVGFFPPLPFADATFDLILCVEVLEHLLPDLQDAVPREIWRLLRPKGRVLFTTPNSENLAAPSVYCPFCETVFHRRQHVRSISPPVLRRALENIGFSMVMCEGMDLRKLQQPFVSPWKDWSLRQCVHMIRGAVHRSLDALAPRPFPDGRFFRFRAGCKPNAPHLCAIVQKP